MLDSMALWRGGCKWQTTVSLASHCCYIDRVLVGYLFWWLGRQTWKPNADKRSQTVELMMHLVGLPENILAEPNAHCRVAVLKQFHLQPTNGDPALRLA